jgi:hypothetical protein
MSRAAELAQCEREIARAMDYLMRGGPEDIGAYVGLTDWQCERRLMEEQWKTPESKR